MPRVLQSAVSVLGFSLLYGITWGLRVWDKVSVARRDREISRFRM